MRKLILTLFLLISFSTCFSQDDLVAKVNNPFTEFTNKIHFKTSTIMLSEDYNIELKKIVEIIEAYNSRGDFLFEISSHTNSIGAKEKNKELTQKRSEIIKSMLISLGCKDSQLKAIGYGESRPIDSNKTREGRALNKRIEILAIEI